MNIGGKIISFATVSSTNDVAKELALQGEEEGTVILAEEQTAGRGTKGRSWYSARSLGLYASVILRPTRSDLSLLPLAMGLACREALNEAFHLGVVSKWPNDLILHKKKVGGILLESSFTGNWPSFVIFGFGINVNHEINDFPEELKDKAISLRQACGRKIDRPQLLESLWPKIDFWYRAYLLGEDEQIVASYEQGHIYRRGEEITVVHNGQEIVGLFDGFTLEGALKLVTAQGVLSLTIGELSLK